MTEKKRKRQELAAAEAIAKVAKLSPEEGFATSEQGVLAEQELASLEVFPSVIVLDLDDTVWVGDVDMTSGPPFTTDGRGLPILAQKGGHGDKLVPFPDVHEVFDWIEEKGMKVVASTHTYRPEWAHEVLSLLETTRGTPYSDLFVIPIGKEVQKKTKDVHLKSLAASLGCECSDMVFFDDKEGNVRDGNRVGATSCTTADGLSWSKFVECFKNFANKKTGVVDSSAPTTVAPKAIIPKAVAKPGTILPKAVAKAGAILPKAVAKIAAAPKVASSQVSSPNTPSWAARTPPMVAAQWPDALWPDAQWPDALWSGGKGSAVASWKGGSAAVWPWAFGGHAQWNSG